MRPSVAAETAFGRQSVVNGERGISLDTAAMLCDYLDLDVPTRR